MHFGSEKDRGVVGFCQESGGMRKFVCGRAVCGNSCEGKGRRADFPLAVMKGEMLESL